MGRLARMWKGKWRMSLVFGKGMISDDTEHTLMVAQALLAHPDDCAAFQRALGWKLRWWFLGLPAGVGMATAKACIKLWLGFPPGKSAVASAGSGTAMRSAVIGAFYSEDARLRKEFVLASSRLTHRSWQADTAALAVAEAAALAFNRQEIDRVQVFHALEALSTEHEWGQIIAEMKNSLSERISVADYAGRSNLAKGVTGYALHVVPVALYAWLRHPGDFRAALTSALDCGGDTDTVGAILGALSGASVGRSGIPTDWLQDLWEWPRSTLFIERVAARLTEANASCPNDPVPLLWPAVIIRNLFFLLVVLCHGFRRLLPPY